MCFHPAARRREYSKVCHPLQCRCSLFVSWQSVLPLTSPYTQCLCTRSCGATDRDECLGGIQLLCVGVWRHLFRCLPFALIDADCSGVTESDSLPCLTADTIHILLQAKPTPCLETCLLTLTASQSALALRRGYLSACLQKCRPSRYPCSRDCCSRDAAVLTYRDATFHCTEPLCGAPALQASGRLISGTMRCSFLELYNETLRYY